MIPEGEPTCRASWLSGQGRVTGQIRTEVSCSNRGGRQERGQNPRLREENPAEMAGSKTTGREHVPRRKQWPVAPDQTGPGRGVGGQAVKCNMDGEMSPGSQGDLGENHLTGGLGWKLILGITKMLRRQPSLGHASKAWL